MCPFYVPTQCISSTSLVLSHSGHTGSPQGCPEPLDRHGVFEGSILLEDSEGEKINQFNHLFNVLPISLYNLP